MVNSDVLFLLVMPSANPMIQLELSANIAQDVSRAVLPERVVRAATFTELRAGASHRLVQVKPMSAFAPQKHGLFKREADHAGDPCCARLCPFLPRFQTDHDPLPGSMTSGCIRSIVACDMDTADIRHSNGHPVRLMPSVSQLTVSVTDVFACAQLATQIAPALIDVDAGENVWRVSVPGSSRPNSPAFWSAR